MHDARYKKYVDIVGVTIAAIGVPLFFLQQFWEVERERINRSLAYVDSYRSGEILENRLRLIEIWSEYPVELIRAASPSREIIDKLVLDLSVTHDDFARSILILTDFFDSVSECLRVHECHEDGLSDLMSDHAYIFCNLYGGYIRFTRSSNGLDGFGGGLTSLARLGNKDSECEM